MRTYTSSVCGEQAELWGQEGQDSAVNSAHSHPGGGREAQEYLPPTLSAHIHQKKKEYSHPPGRGSGSSPK